MTPTKIASLYAEIGAKTTSFEVGLVGVKSKLHGLALGINSFIGNNALPLAGAFVTIGVALNNTINQSLEYADAVRDLSLVSGMSADASGRFIQVLDDYKITIGDVMTATRKLTAEGYAPSLETLALLSDEYLDLNTAQEKNEFILKNLGRSGLRWAEVLGLGSDTIRGLNENVREYLILNEHQVEAARGLQFAQDDLADATKGASIAFGTYMTPALEAVTGLLIRAADASAGYFAELANNRTISIETSRLLNEQGYFHNGLNLATREQTEAIRQQAIENINAMPAMEELTGGIQDEAEAAKAAADAIKLMSDENRSLYDLVGTMQERDEAYAESITKLTNERMELEAEKQKLLSEGYTNESAEIIKINEQLEENSKKAQENADEHELANRKIILGLIERKLTADGILDDKELNWLLEKGMAWGIYSETVITEAREAMAEADMLAGTIERIPDEKTTDINVNTQGAEASIDAVASAIRAIPEEKNIFVTLYENVIRSVEEIVSGTSTGHAAGGTFQIPMSYGNEGFRMGNGDTASGGELVSITPKGQAQSGNADLIAAINSNRMDEKKLARSIIQAMAQAGV